MADPKTASDGSFLVGGIALPRPFQIRRLGHFGLDMNDVLLARDFYERLMGFRVSDHLQLGARLKEEDRGKFGHETGYFMRHGTDHHSFVIFPRPVRRSGGAGPAIRRRGKWQARARRPTSRSMRVKS